MLGMTDGCNGLGGAVTHCDGPWIVVRDDDDGNKHLCIGYPKIPKGSKGIRQPIDAAMPSGRNCPGCSDA